MPRLSTIRPIYCFLVFALFTLGGCQTLDGTSNSATSSDYVNEAAMQDLEASSGDERALSPLEQHMKARGDVDPVHVNRKNRFSKTVDEYRQEQLAKASAPTEPKAFKIESDPIKKQEQAKSYVETILAKHKARQDSLKKSDSTINRVDPDTNAERKVIPPSKPAPIIVANSNMRSQVSDVRIGQHPGKTRIVIDVSDKSQFQTSFEDNDKVLVVSLPGTSWGAEAKTRAAGQSLVAGYDAANIGSGAVVKIMMNAPATLAYQKAIKPSGTRGHRIVLDVVEK